VSDMLTITSKQSHEYGIGYEYTAISFVIFSIFAYEF
jgi:hypothetical protein